MSIVKVQFHSDDMFAVMRVSYSQDYYGFKDRLRSNIKHIVSDNWINIAFLIPKRQLIVKVKKSLTMGETKELEKIFSETLGIQ